MEISVTTKFVGDDLKFNLSINGMSVTKLPSFSVDRIREMVRPQIEALLILDGCTSDKGEAEDVSRRIVYGTPPSQSASGEDCRTSDF